MKTARVVVRGGVPQLHIDGRPVRARIFWGGANAGPLALEPAERELIFTFVPPLTTKTGTLHLRFGQEPGQVAVRDVTIVEETTGKVIVAPGSFSERFATDWNVWPPPEKNTVGKVQTGRDGLRVTLTPPPGGAEWPDFHVFHAHTLALTKGQRYKVTLRASASPARSLTIALYQPGTSYNFLGGPAELFDKQVRLAAAAGIDLVSFEMPVPWPAPGQAPDWSGVDAVCERVLSANPRALLLPRVGLYPPPEWLRAHPDAVMRWDDGDHGGGIATAASAEYQKAAAERLAALIGYVERRWGDKVLGYHPTGQNTGEWFWMDSWTGKLPGYAPDDARAWSAWCRAQGFPETPVPPPTERRAPAPSLSVQRFHRFLSESMATCVTGLAQIVRRETQGRKLSVFFYGYGFEFAPMPSGPANAGHHALRHLLDSPDIDILCGPFSYFERSVGGTGPVMSCAESVLAAGKLWLNEDDTRTYLARERNLPGWDSGADDLPRTLGILTRDLAVNTCRNLATWWMDLPGTGWFADAAFWDIMRQFERVELELLRNPVPFVPEVALILDETAVARLTSAYPPLSAVRQALGRLGAPYGQYLADDLLAGRCPAKLIVVVCADVLSPERRAAIEKAATGKTIVWVGAVTPTSEQLRQKATLAGVRLYCETDALIVALGPLLGVSGVTDGALALELGHTRPLRDALTGISLGKGPRLNLFLRRGETRLIERLR